MMHREDVAAFLQAGALISLDQNKLAIGWGGQNWHEAPSEQASFSFYFPDFFLKNERPWLVCENNCVLDIEELRRHFPAPKPISKLEWVAADKSLFLRQCAALQSRLRDGNLDKGVPFSFEQARGAFDCEQRLQSLLSCLKKAEGSALSIYGFWNTFEGMLGVTPELLFRQEKQEEQWAVETCAVAGTISATEDAVWRQDLKLVKEHEIVVRDIEERLASFGSVEISPTYLSQYAKLFHLKTPMKMSLKGPLAFEKIVHTLHPTPALGAYPRGAGKAWLEEMQTWVDRGRFGAPVGGKKRQSEEGHCLVAIRNIQWKSQAKSEGKDADVMLCAGCGVVAESDLEAEWQELQLKIKSIKEMLAL